MNLTVQIAWKHNEYTDSEHLEAWVIQDGKRGAKNLLAGRQFTKLDSAHLEIQSKLAGHKLTVLDPPEPKESPAIPLTTARDDYGMKGVRGYKNRAL